MRRAIRSCEEQNSLGCSGVASEGGRDVVKAQLGQVTAAGVLHGNGLSTTASIPTTQSTNKHTSDTLHLRGGWRVNVLKESAANALIRTKSADVIVKAPRYVVADVGVDGDMFAVPLVSTVNAEVDVSKGPLGRKHHQCLDFTFIDVQWSTSKGPQG